jgi:uncharacterized membrane protein YccC
MDRFSIVTSGFCVLTVLNLRILLPKNYLFVCLVGWLVGCLVGW